MEEEAKCPEDWICPPPHWREENLADRQVIGIAPSSVSFLLAAKGKNKKSLNLVLLMMICFESPFFNSNPFFFLLMIHPAPCPHTFIIPIHSLSLIPPAYTMDRQKERVASSSSSLHHQ